jgi:hypothetical protein
MPYSAEISRVNPTCFLFLIDQSESMLKLMAGGQGKTKAEAVADSVNNLLYTLVLRCVKGNSVLDRFHVGVLGYGRQTGPALGGTLANRDLVPVSEVARAPLRVEERPDTSGGPPVRLPVWFEPLADGKTPMCATLDKAIAILTAFLAAHPNCYPPMVINLTDGAATDGNPEEQATRLRALSSSDGKALLFNLHVTERAGAAVEFPDKEGGLADGFARRLFRMSSTLPAPMWDEARLAGVRVTASTRGFVFNADMASVIRFLNIGTQINPKNMK